MQLPGWNSNWNSKLSLIFIVILIIAMPLLSWVYITFKNQPKKLPCPVPKQLCKTVKIINRGKTSYLGYTAPSNTPVLTIGTGVIRVGMSGGGKYQIKGHPILFQENPDGTTYSYEFFGTYATPSATLVPGKTEIGKIDTSLGDFRPIYDVSLIIGIEKNKHSVSLKPGNIEQ